MIKCSFCGSEFNQNDSISSCSGCPMSKSCSKSRCPKCGYEILKEPALIKFIKKKWGKNNA